MIAISLDTILCKSCTAWYLDDLNSRIFLQFDAHTHTNGVCIKSKKTAAMQFYSQDWRQTNPKNNHRV